MIRGNCARYVCLVTKAPSADGPSSHPRIPIESPLECPSNPPLDGAIRVHRFRGSDGLFCLSRRLSNAAVPQLAPVRKAAWTAHGVVRQHCSTVHPPCATVFGVGEYPIPTTPPDRACIATRGPPPLCDATYCGHCFLTVDPELKTDPGSPGGTL